MNHGQVPFGSWPLVFPVLFSSGRKRSTTRTLVPSRKRKFWPRKSTPDCHSLGSPVFHIQ